MILDGKNCLDELQLFLSFFKYLIINSFIYFLKNFSFICNIFNSWGWGLGIGDWGLGIGDWAQSPIPNPQSPIPNPPSP